LAHSVFARFALILALLTAFFEVEYDKSYRKSPLSYRITWTDWHCRARGHQWELSFHASARMRDENGRHLLGVAIGEGHFTIYADVVRILEWIEQLAGSNQSEGSHKPSLRKVAPTPAAT
jgi:hypothetical protein